MENNSSSSQFLPKLTGVTNMLLFFYFILATEASIVTTSVSDKVGSNKDMDKKQLFKNYHEFPTMLTFHIIII